MSDKRNGYAVWKTEGGGLVKRIPGERFEFVVAPIESPDNRQYKVGDKMPDGWSIHPYNSLAVIERNRLGFTD